MANDTVTNKAVECTRGGAIDYQRYPRDDLGWKAQGLNAYLKKFYFYCTSLIRQQVFARVSEKDQSLYEIRAKPSRKK